MPPGLSYKAHRAFWLPLPSSGTRAHSAGWTSPPKRTCHGGKAAAPPPFPRLQSSLGRLDLSYNCISRVEALSSLTALEDLSLYSNKLTSVEALTSLGALRALSVGERSFSTLAGTVRQSDGA